MTALQTRQSSLASLNGQDFFRLLQDLESGGDIFEIDTSTHAICVGPQSDLANYNVHYFDPQSPDSIEIMNLAISNPAIGRMDALLDTQYPAATGLPAYILVSPRDLVDNNWLPNGFTPPTFGGSPTPGDVIIARPKPRIDVMAYYKPQGSLAPLRDDRLYTYPFASGIASPYAGYYILPYYGRRYAEFSIHNLWGGGLTYTVDISGINLFPGAQDTNGAFPGEKRYVETALGGGSIVVTSGTNANRVVRASVDGMFDLLVVAVSVDPAQVDAKSRKQIIVIDRVE